MGSGLVFMKLELVCLTDWVIVHAGMIDMVVVIAGGEDMEGEVR